MKKILPLFAILALAACGNSEKVTEQAVYTIGNTLAVAEQGATEYAEGKFGTPKADVLEQIQKYDNVAKSAADTVIADSKAGNALTSVEKTAATNAIELFVKYLASQGVTVTAK